MNSPELFKINITKLKSFVMGIGVAPPSKSMAMFIHFDNYQIFMINKLKKNLATIIMTAILSKASYVIGRMCVFH